MPDPVLPGRLGLYLSMLHYGWRYHRDFAREHAAFHAKLRERVGAVAGRRVLDVGCGKSYWLTLLLATDGADVTGVDTELVRPGLGWAKLRDVARHNGIERALRTAAWDVLFARGYYRELARCIGRPLAFERCDLRVYDGVNLDLPDASVDLVVSHEVFEHVADLDGLLASLQRVLKPDGRTYIYIHAFTSLSGGHHIAWKHPDTKPSRRVPPWDHLRERRHADIPSWLNGLREADYRRAFERRFDILDWIRVGPEGTALLTPEIRRELASYSEDELLTKGYIVIAAPRRAGAAAPDEEASRR
jgi:SAM-dependent methyltransferase